MSLDFTWYSNQLLQLLFQTADFFTQLYVIHPAKTEQKGPSAQGITEAG